MTPLSLGDLVHRTGPPQGSRAAADCSRVGGPPTVEQERCRASILREFPGIPASAAGVSTGRDVWPTQRFDQPRTDKHTTIARGRAAARAGDQRKRSRGSPLSRSRVSMRPRRPSMASRRARIGVPRVDALPLTDLPRQPPVLGFERHAIADPLQHDVDLAERERLGQVVVGAEAHRLDRRVERRVARHDDDVGRRIGLLDRAQHPRPSTPGSCRSVSTRP